LMVGLTVNAELEGIWKHVDISERYRQ
jgi:hypothetical protein